MVEALAKPLSDSVQMYLVKIKRLEEQINPVPLSFLADSLCISPVSVNEMCRKMQEQNLIDYQPYKGASLTPAGEREALQVLRRHRLWEVFLVEKLRFSFEQAHKMADELEHATSSDLADRLDDFLGNPPVNPQGKEIPRGEEKQTQLKTLPLSALCAGEEGYCLMEGLAQNIQDYLNQAGIHNGGMLQVRGKTAEMMLLAASGEHVSLALQLCQEIRIIKTEKNKQPQVSRPAGRAGTEAIIKEKVHMEKTETIKLNQVRLDRMKIGQKGTVVSVGGKGPIKQRMMDMGLVPGSEVKILRVAPLGDPIELTLKGYNLSVRKNEAKAVLVEIEAEE